MTFRDFIYPFLFFAFAFALGAGICVVLRLSVLEDEATILRKRVNGLELRVYRIELKTKTGGEVASETRD